MKDTAVVILNYNGRKFLEKFLPGVLAHTPTADVVVADNASVDGSIELLSGTFPEVRCIEIPENLGFCGGYNYALRLLPHKYFVLLNSDVEVTAGWLPPLIGLMEENQSVAACQPKIKAYHQKNHFEYAGAAGGFLDVLGYPFARGRIFDSLEEDRGQFNQAVSVFWASGACMCIRAELYKKYQLDEAFFAHMEEIDLCWRLQNNGWQIACEPSAKVYHVGGGTLKKDNPRKTFYNFRNGLFLLFKNLPFPWLVPVLLARMALDGVAALKFISEGKIGHFKAVWRAHIGFYANIPSLKRRGTTQAKRKRFLSLPTITKGSVVFGHFLMGKKYFSAYAISKRTTPLGARPTKMKSSGGR